MTDQKLRKIDVLIAERVMGLTPDELFYTGTRDLMVTLPKYSTDFSSCKDVIEKMDEMDFAFYVSKKDKSGNWECIFQQYYPGPDGKRETHKAEASMFSTSICLAALKAVGVKI